MNSKSMILLKTMLLSTSPVNVLKYSKDNKRKKKARGAIIGKIFIYLYLLALMFFMSVGYGAAGIAGEIPTLCMLVVSSMAFMFTVFRTNGYMFNFKEFDMLVAMPFDTRSIVACKFLYMYIKSFAWYFSISVGMLVAYAVYVLPPIYVYPLWLLLTLVAPLIPTVVASLIGSLFAKVSSGFKYKKAIQAILTFAIIFVAFFSRYIIEAFAKDGKMSGAIEDIAEKLAATKTYYPPIGWFVEALTEGKLLSGVILIVASVVIFAIYYNIVARSYIQINSRLATHEKKNGKGKLVFKPKSVYNTIAYKEFKRMTGSVTYLTQAGFGFVFVAIVSIIVLFFDGQQVVSVILQGAPVEADLLLPAIPFVVFFFTGMVSTCAMTPSLEGKNEWILSSMPVSKKVVCRGKMLFNIYLQLPFTLLGVICFGICFRANLSYMLVFIICSVALCAYSTTYGMFCGLKYLKLEWENEIEVVKQSAAVTVYLLPNMFITMILMVGLVFLSIVIDGRLALLLVSAVYAVLALLFYRKISK